MIIFDGARVSGGGGGGLQNRVREVDFQDSH